MKQFRLTKLVSQLRGLTAAELIAVSKAVKEQERNCETNILLENKAEKIVECPHCHSDKIGGHGITTTGKKRFKCKDCGKTFNALTKTPFARLKFLEKHLANAKCMLEGLSVRKTAARIGVSKNTAFFWRHKFLEFFNNTQPQTLTGIVEADETYFRESFKGKRGGESVLGRKPKKRGTPATKRGLSKEQIPVLVARDRTTGATLSSVLKDYSTKEITRVLEPVVSTETLLCTDGAKTYRKFGAANNIIVKSSKRRTSGTYHIQNVNSYHSRLKNWMARFNGVATKNLANYLSWHRVLDTDKELMPRDFLAISLG